MDLAEWSRGRSAPFRVGASMSRPDHAQARAWIDRLATVSVVAGGALSLLWAGILAYGGYRALIWMVE